MTVDTPWGKSLFPLQDLITRKLVQQGFQGDMCGELTVNELMQNLIGSGIEISTSAMIRSLVQLRRGRMISLSAEPVK